jgi:outer membrane lipoprotein carrier protein
MMANTLTLIFVLLSGSMADTTGLKTLIDKTCEKYSSMKSFYAEFNQVFSDETAGTCQNYQGKIYFHKPNFFRMEFRSPHQILVGDSVSLWIYLPDEHRAIRQNLGPVPFIVNPDMFLKDYEENFDAELIEENGDTSLIGLIPKQETDIYQRISITIHNKRFEILAISILDDTGVDSKFNFKKIEINKKISMDLFRFNPPKGTKIDEY